ncbi:LV545 protein, partial [Psilopogon haemacephalus]|nr:LV545 protein [Psilopogon haemacephalus]
MLLLLLLALAATWSYGQAQMHLIQNQVSLTKRQSTTARIECRVEGVSDFTSFYIHWYQQLPSSPPKRILYMRSSPPSYDDSSLRYKYSSEKQGENVYILAVNDVNSNDEGIYHCALWQY